MTVLEYANKFNELGHFCPNLIEFERSKANIFEHGLGYKIWSHYPLTLLTTTRMY